MSAPLLTLRQRQQVAERYQDGESMPQLAEVYAVRVQVIHRVLIKAGVPRRSPEEYEESRLDWTKECRECGQLCHKNAVRPLCIACAKRFCEKCDAKHPPDWHTRLCRACKWAARYKDRPPRLCRVCGRMGARGSKRDLCAVHSKVYCRRCDAGLPALRVNAYCTTCEHERKLKNWDKDGRRCAQCGEGMAREHSSRCTRCLHEEYEVKRWAWLHLDRPCRKCGVLLTKGRQVNYCQPCERQRVKERRRQRLAIGAHRCAMCKDVLPLSRGTYCGGCDTMLNNWRRAWHQGCPVARQLGTVRTPKRHWQEEVTPA